MLDVLLTREPLDEARARAAVSAAAHGAVLVFHGIVRDHHEGKAVERIDYHAYEAMARRELEDLARQTVERFSLPALALHHRIGDVAVGEASLLVAAGHAHRAPTFEAASWLIDVLKRRVPIWKKEYGPDGEHWVGGVLPEAP